MLAHTLGNPFDLDAVAEFAERHDLWLIEDNCDALGSALSTASSTGTFGDLATRQLLSGAPHHDGRGRRRAHQIADAAEAIVESFRDWGRDCWCDPGNDNTCGKRFEWQLGDLPFGYDHKYIYTHLGYNLKVTDMQAAVGLRAAGEASTASSPRAARTGDFSARRSPTSRTF